MALVRVAQSTRIRSPAATVFLDPFGRPEPLRFFLRGVRGRGLLRSEDTRQPSRGSRQSGQRQSNCRQPVVGFFAPPGELALQVIEPVALKAERRAPFIAHGDSHSPTVAFALVMRHRVTGPVTGWLGALGGAAGLARHEFPMGLRTSDRLRLAIASRALTPNRAPPKGGLSL
jgi:hypothetical protein